MTTKTPAPPRIIFPISANMVRDAEVVRTIVVDALKQFKHGKMSIKDAYVICNLAKQAIDAMKLEYILGPRVLHESEKK